MAITKKQKELDLIKWNKSAELGKDACGTFDYCAKCNKEVENPCDKAYTAFNKPVKAVKKEVAVTADSAKKPAKRTCKKK